MSRAIFKIRGNPPKIIIVGSVAGLTTSTDQTTHEMGNIDVGAISSNKKVILGITWTDSSARTILSLTVGVVSLTQQVTAHDPGDEDVDAAVWSGDISSLNGLQAISVTFSGNVQSVGVSAVSVFGMNSITADNSSGDISTLSLTIAALSAPKDGITFACGVSSGHDNSALWSSLTERADVQTGTDVSEDHRHTSAWDTGLRVENDEILIFTGGNQTAAVGAGFR